MPNITTLITRTNDYAEEIFETAEAQGVDHLKLGYWHYDGHGTIHDGLPGATKVRLERRGRRAPARLHFEQFLAPTARA